MRAYLSLLRIDHWTKNFIVVLGGAFSIIVLDISVSNPKDIFQSIFMGFLIMCLASSANYVMNEFLDAKFDVYHPRKKFRASVKFNLQPAKVWILYFGLVVVSIFSISFVTQPPASGLQSLLVFYFLLAIIYNVRPVRVKDLRFLDVLIESANNPVRLLFGWMIVSPNSVPPLSLLFFWSIGFFLMSAKRLAELTELKGYISLEDVARYRRSLGSYSEYYLLMMIMVSAQLSAACMIVFTLKYSVDFLPFFILVVIWTSHFFTQISQKDSIAQSPEKLIQDKSILIFIIGMSLTLLIANSDHSSSKFIQDILQSTNLNLNNILSK